MSDSEIDQSTLVDYLREPACYDHAVDSITVEETHISWILLTGPFAYKIKKAVDLGFLDFRKRSDRKFYCEEEVRLNQRTAPDMYRGVRPITGTVENPTVDGDGDLLEWCVKMKQFDRDQQVSVRIERGDCSPEDFTDLARRVARFHQSIDRADTDGEQGNPEEVHQLMTQNFDQVEPLVDDPSVQTRLDQLRAWSESTFEEEYGWFERRTMNGAIGECHGDMHLKNMFYDDGEIKLFDCIEFNEDLRWIDVMNDVACLLVDLDIHDKTNWAHRFLNTYLNWSGDYEGVAVLRFYRVYRAMVRAKVELLGADDPPTEAFFDYLEIAERDTDVPEPFLAITRGPSASGKSHVTDRLIERVDAIRLQSDVVRKQVHGLDPDEESDSPLNEGMYTKEANERTYQALAKHARTLLQSGYPVVVDASFLNSDRRRDFHELAMSLDVPFHILNVTAEADVLRERVRRRASEESPSEAGPEVLEHQLDTMEPLNEREQSYSLEIDTTDPVSIDHVIRFLGANDEETTSGDDDPGE